MNATARASRGTIAAGLLLLSACTGSGSTTTPIGSASAAPPSPSVAPSVEPSVSSPGPSAPALSDELAIRVVQVGDVGWIYPVAQVTVMADGRVITPPTERVPWQERRLTPDAVDALMALASETGLFASSANYPMEHRPDAPEWPGMGGSLITITVGSGSNQVVVSGGIWFGDEFETTFNVPSPERKALSQLAARLADLSWLERDDWLTAQPQPYEPTELLLITSWYSGGEGGLVRVDDVAWPFEGSLADFGQRLRQSGDLEVRCGIVDNTQAQAIIDEIEGGPRELPGAEYGAQLRSDQGPVDLHLMPLLPDRYPACDELLVG